LDVGIPGNSPKYLVEGYPRNTLADFSTVVDVGGSQGYVNILLALRFPHLRFTIQDRPKGVQSAKEKLDAEIAQRIDFQAYDFFTEQPFIADAYLFRWNFHD
jgi:trans-aconitate methyltransferase